MVLHACFFKMKTSTLLSRLGFLSPCPRSAWSWLGRLGVGPALRAGLGYRVKRDAKLRPARRAGPAIGLLLLGVIASAAFAAEPARTVSAPSEGSRIVIETPAASTPAPVFFSASVDQTVRFGASEILGQWRLKVRVVQGRPELLTLGLAGEGEIMEVTGAGLRDWAVRQGAGATAGKRFLDLRPLLPAASPMT